MNLKLFQNCFEIARKHLNLLEKCVVASRPVLFLSADMFLSPVSAKKGKKTPTCSSSSSEPPLVPVLRRLHRVPGGRARTPAAMHSHAAIPRYSLGPAQTAHSLSAGCSRVAVSVVQGEMGSTTPDGDVLGTLAVAMSKHGMMMPYLSSASRPRQNVRSGPAVHAPEDFLCAKDVRYEAEMEPNSSTTRCARGPTCSRSPPPQGHSCHSSCTGLCCGDHGGPRVQLYRDALLRVTLAGDLACLKELIEICTCGRPARGGGSMRQSSSTACHMPS